MKLLSNLKTFFTEHVASKDFTLRFSQMGAAWDRGKDNYNGSLKGRPSDAYSQVDWVWICVNLIVETCKSIPLVISNSKDEVVESGPLYDFIYNKNFSKFLQETVGFYTLFREVYWIVLDSSGMSPKNILVAGPNSCEPVTEKGQLVAYRLHLGGGKSEVLLLEDVHVIKNFNPADPHRGVGPLKAGELAIATAYQSEQYSEATLANGAKLGVVLQAPKGTGITEPERQKLLAQFKARHSGAKNAGAAILLEGIDKVEPFSQTMADLQMVDLSKYTAGNICSLFGVPPEIVGLNNEAQYAHGPATQRFIMYCIGPLLDTIGDGIDDGIITRFRFKTAQNVLNRFEKCTKVCCARQALKTREHYRRVKQMASQKGQSLFSWFDVDSHPAIQEMMRDRSEKLMGHVEKGVPLKQVIEVNDLPYDTSEIPWAGEHLVPMGMVTARSIVDGTADQLGDVLSQTEEEEKPKSEERSPKQIQSTKITENEIDKDAADRIWKRYVASWLPLEKQYAERVRQFFREQKKELLAKLAAALDENKSVKANPDQVIARVVFDLVTENKKLRVINRVFFERASDLGIAQATAEVTGLVGDALKDAVKKVRLTPVVRNSLAVSSQKISSVNKTTREAIANQLRRGLEGGEGLTQLTDRIEGVLDTSRGRAASIARTQVSGAVSAGRHAGMQEAGVEKKGWLTAGDDVVRHSHRAAQKQYADGIPINQPFIVGGVALMYPGDPAGTPEQIINCRCLQVARILGGKMLDVNAICFLNYDQVKPILNEV